MNAAKIFLSNFRNFGELDLELDAAINIFLGRNAQGKTNILEAIHFASLGSSRAAKDSELVRWGETSAVVRIDFVKAGISHRLAIEVAAEKRRRMAAEFDWAAGDGNVFAGRFIHVQGRAGGTTQIFGRGNIAGVAGIFCGFDGVQPNCRAAEQFAEKNSRRSRRAEQS